MKIFSPHRRKMEANRRYGSKEFKNKIKKAQGHKRVFDNRSRNWLGSLLHQWRLDSWILQLGVLGVVLVVGYFLFVSPYFLVSDISVSGTQQVSADQVVASLKDNPGRWMFIPKNHILLMTQSRVLEKVSNDMPLIKALPEYSRIWPNRISLSLEERRPGFALNVENKNYLVDEDGVVVKEVADVGGLVTAYDQVPESVIAGETLSNTKLVAFIISTLKNWPSKVNSQIKEVRFPGKAATQAQFVSSEGWGVFFDVSRPVESQLSNLSLILNRQIPAQNRLKLAYIDLRFDKWAYYCYKDSPCESQPQTSPDPELTEKVEVE